MDYQVMPALAVDEYEDLKADIAARGVMVPIEFDEHGNVLDGHHRLKICKELGITDYPKTVRAGMTEAEKRTHARKLNMARRQLSAEQKRTLTKEQLFETPEKSDRQIASDLGVSNPFVSKVRKEMENAGELLTVNSCIGADGKERPRQIERKPQVQREKPQPTHNQPCPDDVHIPEKTQEPQSEKTELEPEQVLEPELPVIAPDPELARRPHVANNSGNNEWYTPSEYIEAARKCMGSIDTDPASNDIAQRIVKAGTYYTAEDNGLEHEWRGNIWMNPPYSADLIGKFIDKLKTERPNYKQAIVLVNNATETQWFSELVSIASCVCFPRSRVKFYMPDGKTGAPLQGQAVIYIGKNIDAFSNSFRGIGRIAEIREEKS